jgi:hypothetical protein
VILVLMSCVPLLAQEGSTRERIEGNEIRITADGTFVDGTFVDGKQGENPAGVTTGNSANQQTAEDAVEVEAAKKKDAQKKDLTETELSDVVETAPGTLQHLQKLDDQVKASQNTKRVLANFLTLANNAWQDVAFSAADFVGKVLYWAVIFGIGGFFLGLTLFLLLRYWDWTSFEWKYYWTVY